MKEVVAGGPFDRIDSPMFRFLEEAARLGPLHVLLWSDAVVEAMTGARPRFSAAERQYVLRALRVVTRVSILEAADHGDRLPDAVCEQAAAWVVDSTADTPARRAFCDAKGLRYHVVTPAALAGFPDREADPPEPGRKRIIVTGCYDWFHSGHVRFFEEVSQQGNLYVVVGHDANIRLLKGEGHPLFSQDERRYMAQSIRFVKQALISSGHGWMDAEPEIAHLKPDAYAVNEDGDVPEKRAFCAAHGLEYIVLKREPAPGLTRRRSTDLRGF